MSQLETPLCVIQVGAGGMGQAWLDTIMSNPDVHLVALVDLNTELARRSLSDRGLSGIEVAESVSAVLAKLSEPAQAVINVTVPVAHHPVNVEAMLAGLDVLCEKPATPTVAQALSLAATAQATGRLLMISQSRRYFNNLSAFREQVEQLGTLGLVTTDFYKAPHFGGFREEMDHVLLLDMAIHSFDGARYVSGKEPVSVYCEEFNPAWSWYKRDAAAVATFEFADGLRYVYTGSWCADGKETSWNGQWRVNGELGTALWDGDGGPSVEFRDTALQDAAAQEIDDAGTHQSLSPSVGAASGSAEPEQTEPAESMPEQIAGSLAEFVAAVRSGETPSGEIHSNIFSLAMVEAAVTSADSGVRVLIADILESAYATAVEQEKLPQTAAILKRWGSAAEGLSAP